MYNSLVLNSLNTLLPFLNSLNQNWCLVGSTSLILHGLENKSEEIDIVTDLEGSKKLEKLLEKFKIKPTRMIHNDHYDSAITEYYIDGTHISILGDLKLKVAEGWVRILEIIRNKEIFDFNGYKVFIPSLSDQVKILRLGGRKKDMVQAEKILSFLKE